MSIEKQKLKDNSILIDLYKSVLGKIREDAKGEELNAIIEKIFKMHEVYWFHREEDVREYIEKEEDHGIPQAEFFRKLMMMVYDGMSPENIAEIGTYEILNMESKGGNVLYAYLFLRGALFIQSCERENAVNRVLLGCIPPDLRKRMKKAETEYSREAEEMVKAKKEERVQKWYYGSAEQSIDIINEFNKMLKDLSDGDLNRILGTVTLRDVALASVLAGREGKEKIAKCNGEDNSILLTEVYDSLFGEEIFKRGGEKDINLWVSIAAMEKILLNYYSVMDIPGKRKAHPVFFDLIESGPYIIGGDN